MPAYSDAHLAVDFETGVARLDGRPLALRRKEFELMSFLVRHAGEVMPRRTLLLAVWGYGPAIRTRTLDVHMARLRSLLGSYGPDYIATVCGTGYRFQPYRTEAPRLALSA